MKTVTYDRKLSRKSKCSSCGAVIWYWFTSGMSECYPHYYCMSCNNVLHRYSDYEYIRRNGVKKFIEENKQIEPKCGCGNNFSLSANPKCPRCGFEEKTLQNIEARIKNPYMILINGSCLYTEKEGVIEITKIVIK